MHFGENKNINPREKQPIKDSTPHKEIPPKIEDDDSFDKGKKEPIQTNQKQSSIETTIVGGVTAGLLLRLILWLF